MNKEDAKKWAELFTAYAEGKTIERQMINAATDSYCWVQVDNITTIEELDNYRIKPQLKTRRKTNVELADWLRNCPEEHREYKFKESSLSSVWFEYSYEYGKENEPCDDVLIRRNHGKWEEPLIEVEE